MSNPRTNWVFLDLELAMVWRRWFAACSTSMAVLLYRMRPPNFITDNLISHRDRGFGFGCWRATMDLGNRRLLLLWGFDDSTKSSERRFLVADSIASSIARRSSSANPCSPSHSSCSPIFTFYVWRETNHLARSVNVFKLRIKTENYCYEIFMKIRNMCK